MDRLEVLAAGACHDPHHEVRPQHRQRLTNTVNRDLLLLEQLLIACVPGIAQLDCVRLAQSMG